MLDERDNRVAEFLELYSTHFPRLQMFVASLMPHTQEDAADVLQETSLVLWRNFHEYASGTNFFGWACKIARLQVLKAFGRRKKGPRAFDAELLDLIAAEAESEYGVQGAVLLMLENCLAKLTEADRTLIWRRYQPGATVQLIAAELGRTANSLSNSLGRIRRSLLECVDRNLAIEVRE